jgi:DNA-binding phage protein
MIQPHHQAASEPLVTICPTSLREAITRSRRSINRVNSDAGLSQGAIYHAMRRGRCSLATFDAICASLGINGYEIEVSE